MVLRELALNKWYHLPWIFFGFVSAYRRTVVVTNKKQPTPSDDANPVPETPETVNVFVVHNPSASADVSVRLPWRETPINANAKSIEDMPDEKKEFN